MLDNDRKPYINGRAMAELDPQRPLKRHGSGYDDEMMDKKPRVDAIANAERAAERERLQNAALVAERNVAAANRAEQEQRAVIAAARQRAELLYAGRAQAPPLFGPGHAQLAANGRVGFGFGVGGVPGAGRPYDSEDEDDPENPILPAGIDADGLPIARGNEE